MYFERYYIPLKKKVMCLNTACGSHLFVRKHVEIDKYVFLVNTTAVIMKTLGEYSSRVW